jgi:hypothetical protein
LEAWRIIIDCLRAEEERPTDQRPTDDGHSHPPTGQDEGYSQP